MQSARPTYWLTRFLILRLLGVVYAVAFLATINQIIPLIGEEGLLPVGMFLKRVGDALGSRSTGFVRLPSIFWFAHSDSFLLIAAWVGLVLSCVVAAGFANAPLLGICWFLYMSFVNVGQEWYGYGWEIQLLETGFLAIFLCPLLDGRPFPRRAPPMLIIGLFRWLVFRIMLGAGLIKIRGDEVWRNRTALYYHFETQPLPGPLSQWFHFLPRAVLRFGVWYNWLAELVAPWFVFWPRLARHIAGCVIVVLQVILIVSGNLSFLNWLTIVPALACFDDGFWSRILPLALVRRAEAASTHAEPSRPMMATAWVVTGVIALLSIQPVLNMLSPRQIMNTSFDPFNLVNTYGAFGSVGRERLNVVFEGTMDEVSGRNEDSRSETRNDAPAKFPDDKANWKAYPYRGLPVELDRRPPQIAPYQLRLDWQMWFAAMSSPEEYPWTLTLVSKLLHNDPGAVSLLAGNPFPDRPPRYIRAVLYRYTFAKPGNPDGRWWNRERVGLWLPAMSADDPRLIEYAKHAGL
ncbi:MAG TPA: lipase maturation factor family protein [Puia sp.]|nr:lipase maturation factor family protein [Puia sp.]